MGALMAGRMVEVNQTELAVRILEAMTGQMRSAGAATPEQQLFSMPRASADAALRMAEAATTYFEECIAESRMVN